MQEPFKTYFESDKKFKMISIEKFSSDESWIIENFWSQEEKIEIGLIRKRETKSVEEFIDILTNTCLMINNFKEKLECLK